MQDLRNRLVDYLLKIVAVAGAIAYLPGMVLSIIGSVWPIAIADTLAFAVVVLLALRPQWPYAVKVGAVLVLPYLLGVALILWTGPLGAGPLFVFAFVFLAALFFETKGTLVANIIAVLTHSAFAAASAFGWLDWEQPLASVLVILSNFVLISLLLSGAVHFLLRGLNRAAQKERKLRETNDVLLREIEHRVKNNIQVISSLVGVRARAAPAEQALEQVRESLSAMAAVQHLLHRRGDHYHVRLSELLITLTERFRSFHVPIAFICLWEGPEAEVGADQAAVVGLLYNEIVMNARRHAWQDIDAPQIKLSARHENGRLTLEIGDNGQGMRGSEGSGLKIIRALAGQLSAQMTKREEGGVSYRFEWGV